MDSVYAIGLGLGLRVLIDMVAHEHRVEGMLIGLWEGAVMSHFLWKFPASMDPYVAYAFRLLVDFVVTTNFTRLTVVVLWTGLGMVLSDILPEVYRDKQVRRFTRPFRRWVARPHLDFVTLPAVSLSSRAHHSSRRRSSSSAAPSSRATRTVAESASSRAPSRRHVPGSYRSETDTTVLTNPSVTTVQSTPAQSLAPMSQFSPAPRQRPIISPGPSILSTSNRNRNITSPGSSIRRVVLSPPPSDASSSVSLAPPAVLPFSPPSHQSELEYTSSLGSQEPTDLSPPLAVRPPVAAAAIKPSTPQQSRPQPTIITNSESRQPSMIPKPEQSVVSIVSRADSGQPSAVSKAEPRQSSIVSKAESRQPSVVSKAESRHASVVSKAESRQPSVVSKAESRQLSVVSKAESRQPSVVSKAESRQPSVVSRAESRAPSFIPKPEPRQQTPVPKAEIHPPIEPTRPEPQQQSNIPRPSSRQQAPVPKPEPPRQQATMPKPEQPRQQTPAPKPEPPRQQAAAPKPEPPRQQPTAPRPDLRHQTSVLTPPLDQIPELNPEDFEEPSPELRKGYDELDAFTTPPGLGEGVYIQEDVDPLTTPPGMTMPVAHTADDRPPSYHYLPLGAVYDAEASPPGGQMREISPETPGLVQGFDGSVIPSTLPEKTQSSRESEAKGSSRAAAPAPVVRGQSVWGGSVANESVKGAPVSIKGGQSVWGGSEKEGPSVMEGIPPTPNKSMKGGGSIWGSIWGGSGKEESDAGSPQVKGGRDASLRGGSMRGAPSLRGEPVPPIIEEGSVRDSAAMSHVEQSVREGTPVRDPSIREDPSVRGGASVRGDPSIRGDPSARGDPSIKGSLKGSVLDGGSNYGGPDRRSTSEINTEASDRLRLILGSDATDSRPNSMKVEVGQPIEKKQALVDPEPVKPVNTTPYIKNVEGLKLDDAVREAQKAYKEAVNIGSPQLQFKIGSGTKASTLKRRLTKMLEDEHKLKVSSTKSEVIVQLPTIPPALPPK